MKVLFTLAAVLLAYSASAQDPAVVCTGSYFPDDAVELKIYDDVKDSYRAELIQTIPALDPTKAPMVNTSVYLDIQYSGGMHFYYYEGSDFSFQMDELAPQGTPNSVLKQVFPGDVSLTCCAHNSGTYPLEYCQP